MNFSFLFFFFGYIERREKNKVIHMMAYRRVDNTLDYTGFACMSRALSVWRHDGATKGLIGNNTAVCLRF